MKIKNKLINTFYKILESVTVKGIFISIVIIAGLTYTVIISSSYIVESNIITADLKKKADEFNNRPIKFTELTEATTTTAPVSTTITTTTASTTAKAATTITTTTTTTPPATTTTKIITTTSKPTATTTTRASTTTSDID